MKVQKVRVKKTAQDEPRVDIVQEPEKAVSKVAEEKHVRVDSDPFRQQILKDETTKAKHLPTEIHSQEDSMGGVWSEEVNDEQDFDDNEYEKEFGNLWNTISRNSKGKAIETASHPPMIVEKPPDRPGKGRGAMMIQRQTFTEHGKRSSGCRIAVGVLGNPRTYRPAGAGGDSAPSGCCRDERLTALQASAAAQKILSPLEEAVQRYTRKVREEVRDIHTLGAKLNKQLITARAPVGSSVLRVLNLPDKVHGWTKRFVVFEADFDGLATVPDLREEAVFVKPPVEGMEKAIVGFLFKALLDIEHCGARLEEVEGKDTTDFVLRVPDEKPFKPPDVVLTATEKRKVVLPHPATSPGEVDPVFEGLDGCEGKLIKGNPDANIVGKDIWNFLSVMEVPLSSLYCRLGANLVVQELNRCLPLFCEERSVEGGGRKWRKPGRRLEEARLGCLRDRRRGVLLERGFLGSPGWLLWDCRAERLLGIGEMA
ncbi:hypothetical protein KSP40_PGU009298 [Platanthera guangdongensis]|uniref:Uncharacterized protein n=1 Tax=Platanthera guangdongensis TaxID=2320717 RepID=A0ABR2LSU0_9ASPA